MRPSKPTQSNMILTQPDYHVDKTWLNHRGLDCLTKRLFRHRPKKTSKLRVTRLLAFVRGIHQWPLDSLYKVPVKRKMFLSDDVIMYKWHPKSRRHGPRGGSHYANVLHSVIFLKFQNYQIWLPMGCHLQTVYPKKYAHVFCFAVLCCGHTLTDFPISIRLTSLALWQSNDCPSASKATLMNMDKYFMWIHYERLHNHNKAKHNKTVCIFLGIYCTWLPSKQLSCGHTCHNRCHIWAPSQYKDRLIYVWRFPC